MRVCERCGALSAAKICGACEVAEREVEPTVHQEKPATIKEREICARAVERWGYRFQMVMVVEEASELIKAASKVLRHDVDPSFTHTSEIANLAEEAADMEIMLAQIRYMIGDEIVDQQKRKKLDRLAALVKAGMGV